ncbi:MAG TPA: hypothetical protein VNZ86_03425, partial [Bacteroidia bacterium]|nr:hypothetical protein [Bacteroidia bacterium]
MFEAVKGQPAETAEPGLDTSFNKWARPYTSSTPTGPVSVPDLGGPDSHPVPPNLPNSPDEPDFEERWKQMFPKYELSLQKFLSHPEVSDNLNNLKVDRTHDVPYEAGPSKTGSTLYLDKSIPHEAHVSGVSFDPAVPASIHEFTERHVMNQLTKKGMTDEKAYEIAHHEFAEPAEDAWYRAHGIDVPEVNKLWAKWDKGTEQEKADDKDFPKDLYTKPYAHNKVEGV